MTSTSAMPETPSDTSNAASSQAESKQAYGADQIKILEGLEAVRKRPGMYIGDTGPGGLHHLVYEAVDNSIDECMAGRATMVSVRILTDGSICVVDDGSGIPVEIKKHENPAYNGKPAVEIVMTVLHAGGKFGEEGSAYKVSGGLHGVGISCVNALSDRLAVEVMRDGKVHKIVFERGVTSEKLHVIGEAPARADGRPRTGTKVTFHPDPEIFPEIDFSFTTLSHRLRELAYLNPGVTIRITDERVGSDGNLKDETYRFEKGLLEFVAHLNHAKQTLHEIVHLKGENKEQHFACEIAMQYNDSYNESLLCFANNIRTVDGGTHLSGFKTALTRTLNNYAKQAKLLKDSDPMPSGDDLREGLAAVISVKLPEPQFEGQTKGKLRNTDVEGWVSSIFGERLQKWLDEHPGEAKRICLKGIIAAQAREAARKARELTRRKSALESGSMPHKLRDCTTKDVERSEMFIVEGDSAGGSATQGRDVETQAILPLRGKLINVEKARLDKVLAFEEIRTLISALKCGIGEEFDISRLRYGRVIIMTDADVDGSHIRTLLLTFFFRQMPELIRRGKIFIAQPPLYQITRGKKTQYVLNQSRMTEVLADLGLDGASLLVRELEGTSALGSSALRADSSESTERHVGSESRRTHSKTIEGEALRKLVKHLRRLQELVEIAERRGTRFHDLLSARGEDPSHAGRLPTLYVSWAGTQGAPGGSAFAWSDDQAASIIAANGLRPPDFLDGHSTNGVAHGPANGAANGAVNGEAKSDPRPRAVVRELHENREIASIFDALGAMGITYDDFTRVREEAVTGEKLPARFAWRTPARQNAAKPTAAEVEGTAEAGDEPAAAEPAVEQVDASGFRLVEAASLPAILTMLLDVGRRGMEVKRFKGLGEMDPEQLWETTMDYTKRTMLRVTWDDASAADELFTILMGEDVEQRRAYIEEHALEVKSLDV
ncbi:MAG: DNA topoisomerase (ATP-hydrolyzing) subunit B [Phycisphaerales bacterium]